MCGRFGLYVDGPTLERRFHARVRGAIEPHYNIAPTETSPVVLSDDPESIVDVRWGLIPYWAKDPAIGGRLINARLETAPERPAFRDAFRRRHALVPANGFYEWRKNRDGTKTPLFVRPRDGDLWALAGLWERWRQPNGEMLRTFTILTGEPNELLAPIHDRMPVVLAREHEAAWLSGDGEPAELLALLQPYPPELMEAYPVSTLVNKVDNDSADLIAPVASPTAQRLF